MTLYLAPFFRSAATLHLIFSYSVLLLYDRMRSFTMARRYSYHSEGAELIICCHSEGASATEESPCWFVQVTTRFLKICCHSRAPLPTPRTRTRRSGSRPKRRSKGVSEAFDARRKRSRADFATTQSPGWFVRVTTTASQPLLSFSRFAREFPRWFHPGTMTYCHAPDRGIPRPAASE